MSAHAAKDGPWLQAGRLAFLSLYGIALLAALNWALSNVRQIDPQNRAVVTRMGAITGVQNAGLLVAWPRPFEQVVLVPSAEHVVERNVIALQRSPQALQADMSAFDDDEGEPVGDALAGSGYLLTGDAGIVQMEVRIFYKVTEPVDYVLQAEHVIPALERVVTRSAVITCAARDLDTILVARPEFLAADNIANESRERLRSDLLHDINRRLLAFKSSGAGLGIEVARVDVQSKLPRDTVDAFNAVLTASQQAEKNIADARTEAAWTSQNATQSADRIVQVAQARAAEHLAAAQTDTAAMSQLARSMQDKTDPGLLTRVYRERMQAILAKTGSVTLVNSRDDSRLIVQGVDK